MKIHRASKTRFYPTTKQQLKHKQHFNNTRYVYNHYLDLKTKQYKETKKSYSFKETSKDLTNHKKEKPWLNNSSRQAYTNKLKDLNTKGIIARWGKKASDQGWHEFTRQLQYKGTWYGCNIIKIPRFYPSSKTCSNCSTINNKLTLKDRSWTCPACGVDHDRDVNAACNIFNYGRADRKLRTGTGGLV